MYAPRVGAEIIEARPGRFKHSLRNRKSTVVVNLNLLVANPGAFNMSSPHSIFTPGAGTSKGSEGVQLSLQGMQAEFLKFAANINAKLDGLDAKMTVGDPLLDLAPKRTPKPVVLTNGNQQQHDFIEDIQHGLKGTGNAIRTGRPEAALDFVDQGNILCEKRKKLVLYANSTSWAAANEYAGPELAENSDDEKKMRRCENAAERKSRAKTSRGRGRASSGYQRERFSSSDRRSFQRGRFSNDKRGGRTGACHECGRFGHWANECRNKRSSGSANYNNYDSKNKR
jgi:hypothetical protein